MNNLFGRKIGFLKLVFALISDYLGNFSIYRDIRWEKVQRLVFVCQGNICRSAYAEARATKLALPSASAGLGAVENGSADPVAVKFAAKRNINLSGHRTTCLSNFQQRDGDIFICMEPSQALMIRKKIGDNSTQQVTLLGLWSNDRRPFLQDPYGLSDEYWKVCLDIIDSALDNISYILRTLPKGRN